MTPIIGQRRKRTLMKMKTPTPPASPASPSSNSQGVKELAAEVLSNLNARTQVDRFTVFGELIAGHLRNLETHEAITLESRISQTLYDFLGSRASSASPASSTITILDENGLEITDSVVLNSLVVVQPESTSKMAHSNQPVETPQMSDSIQSSHRCTTVDESIKSTSSKVICWHILKWNLI